MSTRFLPETKEISLVPWQDGASPASYAARLTTRETACSIVDLGPAQEAREKLILYRDLYGFAFAPKTPRLFSSLCIQAHEEAEEMASSVQSATDLVESIILQVGAGVADPPLLPQCVEARSDPRTMYRKRYGGNQAESFASAQVLRCLQQDDPPHALREGIREMLLLRERFASGMMDEPLTYRQRRYYTSVCIHYVRGMALWLWYTQQSKESRLLV